MRLFKQLFRGLYKRKPETLSDRVLQVGGKLIASRFRQIGVANNCAPTDKTSDQKIIEIYQRVGAAFRQEAENRGERIPAGNLNAIAFHFVQVYELAGDKFLDEHLIYEIDKYHNEGLRQNYIDQKINLF